MNLPPLFANTQIELVPAETIAEFPVNTFLESIVIDRDNTLYFTSHNEGKVIRLGADGVPTTHATISGKATGLAMTASGELLLSGWDAQGTCVVWQIRQNGEVILLTTLPDAMFLNGLTHLTGNRYLIADAYRGSIWELDAANGSTKIWLEHSLLARSNSENPVPAINGIKIFNRVLYASITQNMQLIRIPLLTDDTLEERLYQRAGEPEIFIHDVNIDDFAFDRLGNLYATTHFYNSLVKITPAGTVTTIAQIEQGMAGSTAVAFGYGEFDRFLYVTTNGGMSLPPATGVETAKVVKLQLDIAGLPK
jgi:sugar lactone lactonase YvrE